MDMVRPLTLMVIITVVNGEMALGMVKLLNTNQKVTKSFVGLFQLGRTHFLFGLVEPRKKESKLERRKKSN